MRYSTDLEGEFAGCLSDESRCSGSADAIALAESESDIIALMRETAAPGMPVTVQGGRTGITGGSVPDGGLILDVSRMNHVLGMRQDAVSGRFTVRVQPGCTLKALNDALLAGGAFDTGGWSPESLAALDRYRAGPSQRFAPDLTESGACVGGVVANNGSGARSFRYGQTRSHVTALRVVLPDGEVLALRRGACMARGRRFRLVGEGGTVYEGLVPDYRIPEVKHAAGLYAAPDMDLVDLFVGSEGVLGVFSELELALTPLPEAVWGLTAFLKSEAAALDWVEAVRESCGKVSAIEFFSAEALDLLRRQREGNPAFESLPELKPDWNSAVYVEVEGKTESDVERDVEALGEQLESFGGCADDTWLATSLGEIETFKGVRHAVPEAVNLILSERKRIHPGITKLGTDLAVPDARLREVMAMYHRDLREAGLEYVIFGHIGNNHVHVNILASSPDAYARGKALYLDWARRVVAMGGSVSAEHGIGKLKTSMLELMFGAEGIGQMREVKRVFDPRWRLNRGNLFAP